MTNTTNTFTLDTFNSAIAPRKMNTTDDNLRIIEKLAVNGCTIDDVNTFTSLPEYPTMKGHVLRKFASFYFKGKKPVKAEPKPATAPATAPAPKAEQPAPKAEPKTAPAPKAEPSSIDELRNAFNAFLGNRETTIDESKLDQLVDQRVEAKFAELMKNMKPQTMEIKIGEHVGKIEGSAHYMLKKVLSVLAMHENVYLFGPAGTGKTVLAQQCAEALGVPFYFTSKIDEVFQLAGFIDANGHYNETELYRCMQTGGVFLFDEIDASASEALTAFNALLANHVFDFPTGKVKQPENMYIIGAGNTAGLGGTAEYNTRQPIDESTRNRFIFAEIGYDPAIENAIGASFSDKQLGSDAVDIVRTIRKFADKNGLEIVASYRDITRLGKIAGALGAVDAVEMCIKNKMSTDDYETLKNDSLIAKLREKQNAFALAI
jgi:MoxR-like ATPase